MSIDLMTEDDLTEPGCDINQMTKINEIIELVNGGVSSSDVFNVLDYGATGDGATDDSVGIRAAMAAAVAAGGGTVYFPNGTYIVSRDAADVTNGGCLMMPANVTLLGQSRQGAIIKLAAAQAAFTRVLTCATEDSILCNLSVDGSKGDQTPEEHMAGVFYSGATRAIVDRVTVFDCCGDAIGVYASNLDTHIEDCKLTDCERSGVAIHGTNSERTTIEKCQILDNAVTQIDVELSSAGTVEDLVITNCYIRGVTEYAISLSGRSSTELGEGFLVDKCVIEGSVSCIWTKDARITNNKITAAAAFSSYGRVILVAYKNVNTLIADNVITISSAGVKSCCVDIQGTTAFNRPTNVRVHRNVLCSTVGEASGIYAINFHSMEAIDNSFLGNSTTTNYGMWIDVTDALTLNRVVAHGNHFVDWVVAVTISSGVSDIVDISVCDNIIEKADNASAAYGIALGEGWVTKATVMGNTAIGLAAAVAGGTDTSGYPSSCATLIGGNRGARGIYTGTGSPESALTEDVGAMFYRRDGANGAVLYVKTSGTGNTGWVQVIANAAPLAARMMSIGPVPAKAADTVHAAYLETGDLEWTGAFTNPDVPRNLRVTFDAGWEGGDVTVVGTNQFDEAVSETFVFAAGAVVGTKIFKTVTGATKTATAGAGDTASIGTGDKIGIPVHLYNTVGTLAVGTTVEAVTYDATYDAFTPTTTPANTTYLALVNVDLLNP